jgi:hypothetical protein
MRSRTIARPLIFGTGLFVAGLAVGAALASWASTSTEVEIRKGATLVSVLPEAVMSLSYASSDGMTTAQRSASGAQFQVLSTFADGRASQRCSVSTDMEGHLGMLATWTAQRSLSPKQRENEFPVQLGVIEVRDAVIGEPSGPMLVFTNKNRTAVAVIIDGRAAEVRLQPATLDWLETSCSQLANK